MPRETLDSKLRKLYDGILVLGSMVESATIASVEALKKHDLQAAKILYEGDRKINAKRYELENELITTIATTQPIVATDLRTVASIYEIISELERMGDYAKGIAKITILIGNEPHIKPIIDIPRMADLAVSMLHRSISAFVNNDVQTAENIPHEDDQVDYLYNQVYRELITIIFSNPSTIEQANYLLWAAHNLERLADRVTNICERTVYTTTGKLIEFDRSDDEIDIERLDDL